MAIHCLILASREDQKFERELRIRLVVFEREGQLRVGGIHDAPAGTEVAPWQAQAIAQANLIVLLVSPRLEADEPTLVAAALERRAAGVSVIPVLLRPIDVAASRYRDLVMLPRSGTSVTAHRSRDIVWPEITKELRERMSESVNRPTQQPAMGERLLAAWLHVSDLHFGHGDVGHGYNQQRVLSALAEDVRTQVHMGRLPSPDLIFVTGDIAFSGGDLRRFPVEDEYGKAASWLDELAASVQVSAQNLVLIPGNHDVQRSADQHEDTAALVAELREGKLSFDDVLANPERAARLYARQARYRAFAARYARADDNGPGAADRAWGSYSRTVRDLTVRILGLNTALLAAGDQDRGRLRVGQRMLTELLAGLPAAAASEQLVLSLSHHPLALGWLADERTVKSELVRRTHCHLSGHVHEAESEQARPGSGGTWLGITAGAAHAEKMPAGVSAGHGYNIAAVIETAAGIKLRTWARRYSEHNADFRPDIDKVDPLTQYAEHDLRLSRRAPQT